MKRAWAALLAVAVLPALASTAVADPRADRDGPGMLGGAGAIRILDAITSSATAIVQIDGDRHLLRAGQLGDAFALPAGVHRLAVTAGTQSAVGDADLADSCTALLVAAQPAGPDHPLAVGAIPECPISRVPDGRASVRLLPATAATDGPVTLSVTTDEASVTTMPYGASNRIDVPAGPVELLLTRPDRPGVVATMHETLAAGTAYTVLLTGGSALIPVSERLVVDGVQPPKAVQAGVHINTDGAPRAGRKRSRGFHPAVLALVAVGLAFALAMAATQPGGSRGGRPPALGAALLVLLGVLVAVGCRSPRTAAPRLPTIVPAAPAPESGAAGSSGAAEAGQPMLFLGKTAAPIVSIPMDWVAQLPSKLVGSDVGWLDGSDTVGSRSGTTVLVGHVVYGGTRSVFSDLAVSRPGETAVVRHNGWDDRYAIDTIASYPKGDLPAAVWAPRALRTLVLITCGGDKDPATGLRRLNVVVTAHLSGSSPAPS